MLENGNNRPMYRQTVLKGPDIKSPFRPSLSDSKSQRALRPVRRVETQRARVSSAAASPKGPVLCPGVRCRLFPCQKREAPFAASGRVSVTRIPYLERL
jgi:hypothetical protein